MRRSFALFAGAVVVTLSLAACSTSVDLARLHFSLAESGSLAYEIDEEGGVTVEPRSLRFRSVPGAYGVTLTGYTISFFGTGGVPLPLDESVQTEALDIFVPAGIQCPTPDAVTGCLLGVAGWRFAAGPEVVSEQRYQLLPDAVARAHARSGSPLGWYAEIAFTGFDERNRTFTTDPYRLTIGAPD
jgi:hypothetical protein